MLLSRKIQQLQQLDQLIRLNCTGSPSQPAQKLEISESSLFQLLQTAKDLGAEIRYNSYRNRYEYITPMRFVFGFLPEARIQLATIKGGFSTRNKSLSSFCQKNPGTLLPYFEVI
ncbi:hypothetical protein [Alkaliflexus imshenetskii]|uniref:hypothetical protein n=1 Tax=Alkaliflexus imshenetskii TaxID=286730 RepID=UPI0004BBA94E|nr:hypothetical protein [Alkaliflexus imshenetskii]